MLLLQSSRSHDHPISIDYHFVFYPTQLVLPWHPELVSVSLQFFFMHRKIHARAFLFYPVRAKIGTLHDQPLPKRALIDAWYVELLRLLLLHDQQSYASHFKATHKIESDFRLAQAQSRILGNSKA